MNYDFETNFISVIKPLLTTAVMKKAIYKGIKSYVKNDIEEYIWKNMTHEEKMLRGSAYKLVLAKKIEEELAKPNSPLKYMKFRKGLYPNDYGKSDDLTHLENDIEEELLDNETLKPDENEPEDLDEQDAYYDEEGALLEKYQKYKDRVMKPFIKKARENSYRTYCLFGGCFWWNATFGLQLARLVMPNEIWRTRRSNIHLSVVNENNTKCFDILYYDNEAHDFGFKEVIGDLENKQTHAEYTKQQFIKHNGVEKWERTEGKGIIWGLSHGELQRPLDEGLSLV